MRLKPVLAAIVMLGGALAVPAITAQPAQAQECPAYWVIGVRGSGQALNGPFNMGSTVGAYVEKAAEVLPAAQTNYLSLPYPARPVGLDYFSSVDAGWQGLQAIIRTRIIQCPQIRIGLVGYSQGAHVVNQALTYLNRVDPGALDYVRAVLLIADPRADATARYHLPITLSGDPAPAPQHGGILTPQMLPASLHSRAISFCISGDPVCDASETGFALLAQGVLFPFHDGYRTCCNHFLFVQILGSALANGLLTPPPNRAPRITVDAPNVTTSEGEDVTNSGTVADPDGNPFTVAASVGTVSVSGDRWTWTHSAVDRGQQTVTITASDDKGGTSSVSFTLNGRDTPPTVDAGPPMVGDEGTPIALLGSADDRTSPPNVTWSYTPLGGVDPGASCSFADPHSAQTTITCTDDGEFTATLTADDGVNPAVSDSTLVTVRNAPPVLTLTAPQPWQVFRAGTPVALSASFTDASANDTHTCSVNWDDGANETYPPNSGRTCDRTHTFAHPGMYTIKAKVTDDDGGVGSADVMAIVYDPDAGFTTAAGHVTSPPGALKDSAAQGVVHFNFNPKYLLSDSGPVPSGGKVDFRMGDEFQLNSTRLEWLVVTPDDKVAVKGVGTVANRPGEYGFLLYAYDADPDLYRLVAWPLADGPIPAGNITYDNRRGKSFDLDEADPQAITTGSIQVHN